MKKIKTYPNHLEIITSVFIPYKDFDLEDFLDDPTRDRFLDIYKYRDSGDNMITRLIKIL